MERMRTMEKKDISRSAARELCVQTIYRYGFSEDNPEEFVRNCFTPEAFSRLAEEDRLYQQLPGEVQGAYIHQICIGAAEHYAELTGVIEQYSNGWQVSRISRIVVAILCVAIYEIRYYPETAPEAAINEAVDLAKRYDGPEAGPFVNGILSAVLKSERRQ